MLRKLFKIPIIGYIIRIIVGILNFPTIIKNIESINAHLHKSLDLINQKIEELEKFKADVWIIENVKDNLEEVIETLKKDIDDNQKMISDIFELYKLNK